MNIPITSIDIDTPTLNLAYRLGWVGVSDFADLSHREIKSRAGVGPVALQKLARAALSVFVRPKWLEEAAADFKYDAKPQDEMKGELAWRDLCGPYSEREQWMLECAVTDLIRGNIDHAIVRRSDGQLEVWRRGGVEVNPE